MTDRRQMSLERVLAEAAPTIVAMATLSVAGLLFTLQMSISEIKSQQARLLEIVRDNQQRALVTEGRVRDLEIERAGERSK
ncbi:MAG: hypothetical protein ACO29V_03400 [Limnohabitans sp.]